MKERRKNQWQVKRDQYEEIRKKYYESQMEIIKLNGKIINVENKGRYTRSLLEEENNRLIREREILEERWTNEKEELLKKITRQKSKKKEYMEKYFMLYWSKWGNYPSLK